MDEKENTRELVVVDVKRYKRVKKALEESEKRYRQLFENVPIGIYRTTPDGRIVDSNPALVKMLGFESFAELSQRNLQKEYSEAGSKRADFIKRLNKEGEIIGLESIWRKKDGSAIQVRENAKLTHGEDGQVFFEGTVEDITQSKQAEEAQRIRTQQIEILNCIISQGNLAESLADMLEVILDCMTEPLNLDMATIFLYDPGAKKMNLLASRGIKKNLHLKEKYLLVENFPFSKVLRGELVFVDNVPKTLPDLAKSWGWRMAASVPLVSKGRVVGAMNVASCSRSAFSADEKNILELIGKEAGTLISKLQTETALRESEKYYRTLIDTSPDVIVVMDLKARLLTVNQQFLKMGGYDYDAVIGASTYDFVVGFDRISLEKKTAKFVKSREMSGSEYQFKKKDGQVIPLEVAAGLLNDDAGHTKGIIAVGRDITERKQAEKLTIALYKISQAVYSTDNLDELFMHIHRALSGIIPAANLFIALLSDGGKTLTFPYVVDEKDAGAAPIIEVDDSQSLTVEVLKTKKTLLLDEVELNERYATGRSKIWETAPKCWLGVPLMIRETVIGVMVVQDYNKGDVFSPKDVTLLESAAGQIAIAIDRKRTESQREAALDALRQSEETFRRTFEAIPDPAYIWARQGDGRFILSRFNRAASQITKGEIKSFLGMEPHLMFADYPKLLENIDSGIIRGGSQNTEFLYKYQSTGESSWLLVDSAKTSDDSVLVITKDITERKQAQLGIEEKNKVLAMLNEISLELASLPPEADINEYISKKMMTITHAIYVGVNYYNKDTRQLEFTSANTASKLLNELNRVLGRKIGSIKYDVNEAMYKEIISEVVGYRNTLHEVSFGVISKKTSSVIQHLFNLEKFIGMALVVEGELIGTVIGAIAKGTPAVSMELLKSVSHIVSVSLRRRQAESQLVASEEKFKKLFYISPDSIMLSRLDDSKIVSINKGFTKILNFKESEVVGKTITEIKMFQSPEEHHKIITALKANGAVENIEYWFVSKSGKNVLGLVSAAIIEINGEKYILSTIRDITERKRAEEQLSFLSSITENTSDAIIVTDADFVITYINKVAEHFFGYTLKELKGRTPEIFNAEPRAPQIQQELYKIISSGKTHLGESLNKRKDGSTFVCEYKVMPLKDDAGRIYAYSSVQRDVSERKQAEAKLLAYQEQLQALTSEMILIEERERRRIASELHDQIGQNLALCKLKVAALEKNPAADEAMKGEMAAIRRLLECSIQDARSLIFDLSPPILYELGLKAALEWLVERIQEQYHVPVEFESRSGGPELDNDRQVILFQVIRELLVNVGKHAQASQAKVILSYEKPFLKIQVNDDGVGFDASQVFAPKEKSGGYGFFSMRERLNYLGGSLEIKSKPGQGSQIILTIPQKATGSVRKKENS